MKVTVGNERGILIPYPEFIKLLEIPEEYLFRGMEQFGDNISIHLLKKEEYQIQKNKLYSPSSESHHSLIISSNEFQSKLKTKYSRFRVFFCWKDQDKVTKSPFFNSAIAYAILTESPKLHLWIQEDVFTLPEQFKASED